MELRDNLNMGFGAAHDVDNETTPFTVNDKAYAELTFDDKMTFVNLRGLVEYDQNESGDYRFGREVSANFDYVLYGADVLFRFRTQNVLSPFLSGGYTSIKYPEQDVPTYGVDREAQQYNARAGVRYRPRDGFRIDIGGSVVHRSFETAPLGDHTTAFIDLDFEWDVTQRLKVGGTIKRGIEQAATETSLADDTTAYELTSEVQISDQTKLEVSAEFERADEIGTVTVTDRQNYNAILSYRPTKRWTFFSEFLYEHDREKPDVVSSSERYAVRVGGKAGFLTREKFLIGVCRGTFAGACQQG